MPAIKPAPQIEIAWRLRKSWRAIGLLKRVAAHAAAAEGFHAGRLAVAVVGARAMSTLHARFLGVAEPTDVLAFDLGTDHRQGEIEGEVILCADLALRYGRSAVRHTGAGWVRTSAAAGCGLSGRLLTAARAELALYLTHGILHLAGYDDHRPPDSRRMHAREDELLTQLGLGPVFDRGAQ